MSAAVKAPTSLPADPPQAAGRVEAAAEVVELAPGTYEADIDDTERVRAGRGMVLPCAHIGPLPGGRAPHNGTAHIATLSDDTLITANSRPAVIRVDNGAASIVVTTYWLAGVQIAPKLRIRPIGSAEQPAPPVPPGLPSLPLTLLAHIERSGDVVAPGGHWVGRPGNGALVEGFAITPEGKVRPADLEYQALLGGELSTPWMRGGEFCGSRFMSLPTLGLRVRMIGRAARRFECVYGASFVGAGTVGPVADGATCAAGGASMEALWVSLLPRQKGR